MADESEYIQLSEDAEGGAPEWVVTFGDMMSLLLCFFILLLSFSDMNVEKYKAVAKSLQQALVGENAPPIEFINVDVEPSTTPDDDILKQYKALKSKSDKEAVIAKKVKKELKIMKKEVDQFIYDVGLGGSVEAKLDDRGLIIVNSDPLMFPSGSAELMISKKVTEGLVNIIKQFNYAVRVEGHTDDRPISTSQFPSNWELSSARASSFVRFLIKNGIKPERLSAVGYGEYHPLVENISTANREKNRRIEIIFEKEDIEKIIRKREKRR